METNDTVMNTETVLLQILKNQLRIMDRLNVMSTMSGHSQEYKDTKALIEKITAAIPPLKK